MLGKMKKYILKCSEMVDWSGLMVTNWNTQFPQLHAYQLSTTRESVLSVTYQTSFPSNLSNVSKHSKWCKMNTFKHRSKTTKLAKTDKMLFSQFPPKSENETAQVVGFRAVWGGQLVGLWTASNCSNGFSQECEILEIPLDCLDSIHYYHYHWLPIDYPFPSFSINISIILYRIILSWLYDSLTDMNDWHRTVQNLLNLQNLNFFGSLVNLANLSLLKPNIRNPNFRRFRNPNYRNPNFRNPNFRNPNFRNPNFRNPNFQNLNILESEPWDFVLKIVVKMSYNAL